MKLTKAFYWTARFMLLALLAIVIFYSGVALALIVVRTLPFITPFLTSQASSIQSGQGASFINAVYPVSSSTIPSLQQRLRIHPAIPLAIAISLLRKIPLIEGLVRRFIPPSGVNNESVQNPGGVNFDLDIPSVSSASEAVNGINVRDARALEKVKGHFLNLGLAFLFLILVVFCLVVSVSIFKSLIVSFNERSKDLVYGTAQLSEELQALPAVLEELQKEAEAEGKKTSVTKKKTSTTKNKMATTKSKASVSK